MRGVIEATQVALLEIQTLQGGAVENNSLGAKENETGSDFSLAMWKEKAKNWQRFIMQVSLKPH